MALADSQACLATAFADDDQCLHFVSKSRWIACIWSKITGNVHARGELLSTAFCREQNPATCLRAALAEWRLDYNTVRPHSSLGNLPPTDYAMISSSASQRDGPLRAIGGFAPRRGAASSLAGANDQPTLLIPG